MIALSVVCTALIRILYTLRLTQYGVHVESRCSQATLDESRHGHLLERLAKRAQRCMCQGNNVQLGKIRPQDRGFWWGGQSIREHTVDLPTTVLALYCVHGPPLAKGRHPCHAGEREADEISTTIF